MGDLKLLTGGRLSVKQRKHFFREKGKYIKDELNWKRKSFL